MSRRRRASLDEEMEEIFHPSAVRQHFSLADLGGGVERTVESNQHFDENDYQSHRTESHHNYHPLHRVHHRHLRTVQTEESPVDESSRAKSDDALPSSERQIEKSDLLTQKLTPSEQLETSSESCIKDVSSLSAQLKETPPLPRTGIRSPLKSALKRYPSDMPPAVSSPSFIPSRTPELQKHPRSFVKEAIAEVSKEEEEAERIILQETTPKVKFTLGASDVDVPATAVDSLNDIGNEKIVFSTPKKISRRSSQSDYKCDDIALRKHQGSDLGPKTYSEILEPDEAKDLPYADIDDLASHRFDDPKGIRRHKIRLVKSALPLSDGQPTQLSVKKQFDHQPHQVFVQLNELLMVDQEMVWRETARWIKYEEDVQVSADRWGKPHVAPLSFHSLLNLRYCLEEGVVILDLEEEEFDEIIDKIVDTLISDGHLQSSQRPLVVRNLLLRHRHGNLRVPHPVVSNIRRNNGVYGNLTDLDVDKNSTGILKHSKVKLESSQKSLLPETAVLIPKDDLKSSDAIITSSMKRVPSHEDALQHGTSILRRIPVNAEGIIVLVGAMDGLKQPVVAFIRLSEGHVIPYLLEVPIPVRFIFVLLGPPDYSPDMDYHEIGRSIATLMSNTEFHGAAYQANTRQDLLSAINTFLDESVVLPPGDLEKRSLLPLDEIRRKSVQFKKKLVTDDKKDEPTKVEVRNPLKRTGKCFGGFFADMSHRFPLYWTDIKDGLNSQCLASTVFIYFASLAGAIAFGGLLEDKTNQLVGVSETLVATCFCGMLFSLLSCQPLIILGTTGPVLMFDEILFQFCKQYEMNFLIVRVWVGVFTAVIATVLVAFEVSSLVRFFSRFMQEIYATVIALMFIVESLMKLIKIFTENPLQEDYLFANSSSNTTSHSVERFAIPHPNTALLSGILMIGTFYIAYSLRKLRNSIFLFRSARRALGDFGVPIGMALMVTIDYFIDDVYTQKLNVPEGFAPTKPNVRGWLITPWPIGAMELVTAAVSGLLIFILLFLETQICELIIGKKERNLKKGSGFHADMMLISYLTIFCAMMGGPWVCAATVRTISHVSSLTIWSRTHAPGEVPHIVEVKEQRITNFFVSLLIGLSVLMTPVLRQVPVAVLFGVFLYMGVSSLSGIQLWERLKMMLMLPKHHPDHHRFVREVTSKKMYVYTLIQLACIGLMWTIKSTILAPGFPFALIGLVFVHSIVKKLFTPKELSALEGEEEESQEEEPDFYDQIVA